MLKLIAFCLMFSAFLISVSAQEHENSFEKPAPGGIRLLDGYHHHQTDHPLDSITGKIWKQHGVTISYDIALNAGDYSTSPEWNKSVLWRTEQVVNGEKVVCVFTKSKQLLIVFPRLMANFYADIHSRRDLADMMLMVLTYNSRT